MICWIPLTQRHLMQYGSPSSCLPPRSHQRWLRELRHRRRWNKTVRHDHSYSDSGHSRSQNLYGNVNQQLAAHRSRGREWGHAGRSGALSQNIGSGQTNGRKRPPQATDYCPRAPCHSAWNMPNRSRVDHQNHAECGQRDASPRERVGFRSDRGDDVLSRVIAIRWSCQSGQRRASAQSCVLSEQGAWTQAR